jgi:hypothetical protein
MCVFREKYSGINYCVLKYYAVTLQLKIKGLFK